MRRLALATLALGAAHELLGELLALRPLTALAGASGASLLVGVGIVASLMLLRLVLIFVLPGLWLHALIAWIAARRGARR